MSLATTSQRSYSHDTLPGPSSSRSSMAHPDSPSTRRAGPSSHSRSRDPLDARNADVTAHVGDPGPSSSTSRTSRRRGDHRKKHSAGSTRGEEKPNPNVPIIALPKSSSHKKLSSSVVDESTRPPYLNIPNATPPSPRLPYFAKYPNRAERLRTSPEPSHSSDGETTSRPSRSSKAAARSGAYSDGNTTSTSSVHPSRLRASHLAAETEESEPEKTAPNSYAWPAKIPSSKLQHLQVPTVSSTPGMHNFMESSSSQTPSPSPLSSRSNSPQPPWHRGRPDPSPPTFLYPRSPKHTFPTIESDNDRDIKPQGPDASLMMPAGFDVSAMDALVAQINGGREHSAVSDLAHLSTSAWPAPPKSPRSTAPSPVSTRPKSRYYDPPPPSSQPTADATPQRSKTRSKDKPLPSPVTPSTPSTTYTANYSPSYPPSLSRSSGVSEVSAISAPMTERSSNGESIRQLHQKASLPEVPRPKTIVPSITDIIRAHAPEHLKPRERFSDGPNNVSVLNTPQKRNGSSTSLPRSFGRTAPSPNVPNIQEESEGGGGDGARSSIDSIAEEVLRSLQPKVLPTENDPRTNGKSGRSILSSSYGPSSSLPATPTVSTSRAYGTSTPASPITPTGRFSYFDSPKASSDTSFGASTLTPIAHNNNVAPNPALSSSVNGRAASPTQEMAQYLRSPRLTRLVKLRRGPNAGITVSLADVGCATGRPVLLYLGLGCVRYMVGLYDELAEALNIRLLCIDRWGLGRSTDVQSEKRGMLEWASVVEEVMDYLGINTFSIVAHSAGAPYALASALRFSDRIHGSVHLLAPWVSQSVDGGYKWLKYIPASLIKTAQTAEWKMHGWKIGKPPTIAWEGIGFDASSKAASGSAQLPPSAPFDELESTPSLSLSTNAKPLVDSRPSMESSDYDDLADFNGRFSSSTNLSQDGPTQQWQPQPQVKKKSSFMTIFSDGKQRRQPSLSSSVSRPSTARSDSLPPAMPNEGTGGGFLRGSKSRTSLRSKGSIKTSSSLKARSTPPVPDTPTRLNARDLNTLPPLPASDDLTLADLGFDVSMIDAPQAVGWDSNNTVRAPKSTSRSVSSTVTSVTMVESNSRSGGKRSLSLSPRPPPKGGPKLEEIVPPLPSFALSLDSPPSPTLSQYSVVAPSFSARSARSGRSKDSTSIKASPYSVGFGAFGATGAGGASQSMSTTSTNSTGTTAAAAKRSQKPGGITLASALMQASHAEALKGGTADLLSILERPDSRPWGFSYGDVRQHVKVWYGDRDERIGISSVRWMEKHMKSCEVKILKGEDHGLLTNAKVVVEVLESVAAEWL